MTELVDASVAGSAGRLPATARSLVLELRPKQWTKNLLVFAGLIFAGEVGHSGAWWHTGIAFVAYSAASSAAYIVNDMRDLQGDRIHPLKQHRPLASGALSTRAATRAMVALTALAFAAAAVLGAGSLAYLAAFMALQLAYSWRLKQWPLVDIAVIAALFEIRAAAGAEAIHVPISGWLLACTPLLAAFLALGKRRAETGLVRDGTTPGRTVLQWYSPPLLDSLLAASAAATLATYTAYAAAGPTPWLVLTVPAVAAGLARYLTRLYRYGEGEEPENMLLTDPLLLLTVAVWALGCALVLLLT